MAGADLRQSLRDVVAEMEEERKRNPPAPTPEMGAVATLIAVALQLLFFGGVIASFHVDVPTIVKGIAEAAVTHRPYANILVGIGGLILAGVLFGFREFLAHPLYAPGEILFGAAVAGYSIQQPNYAGFIGFFAGVRIIVDGYKRIGTLRDMRAEWAKTDKPK
ncbi:hypothetical protein [Methylocystis bryophila]|uniref:Uncharacterized protein n=1 Tax=Methylocystis bryophila TaxID=655015 RepID=A0A1W6MXD4_9HYPH|nr:hypothetical protein [Methylocystis bryophila]ARN82250.1 hypothetical protein B1812_15460 [Methylocystis bryophila]BDV38397.1 hypothetical protein DSM21852_16500 [Methylocystis bryophila]